MHRQLFAKKSLKPYACINFDVERSDFLRAYRYTYTVGERHREEMVHTIEKLFYRSGERILVTATVRTAFQAWLEMKRFPRGSEILMSAVNIPGMPQIVRENQLIPVMYDIEHDTLLPDY